LKRGVKKKPQPQYLSYKKYRKGGRCWLAISTWVGGGGGRKQAHELGGRWRREKGRRGHFSYFVTDLHNRREREKNRGKGRISPSVKTDL